MKIKKTTIMALLTAFTIGAGDLLAQPDSLWSRTFGGAEDERCNAMIQTSDGGFALAGYSYSFDNDERAFYLVKTDEQGEAIFSQTYSCDGGADCRSILQTEDDGFILAGTKGSTIWELGFYIIRTDEDGEVVWSRTYEEGFSDCYSICPTYDGGYLLAGLAYTGFPDDINGDAVVLRINADGDSLWSQTWGGDEFDFFTNVTATSDSGYVLVGGTGSFDLESLSGYIVMLDSNLEEQWSCTYDNNGLYNSFNSSVEVENGGFAMAGYCDVPEQDYSDYQLVRIDSEGELIWRRSFGGEEHETCLSITETNDHCFALAGDSNSFSDENNEEDENEFDFYLVKCDDDGSEVWSCTFGGEEWDGCSAVIQLNDGSFALAGYTKSFGAGESDMWLVKTGLDPVSVPHITNPALPNGITLLSPYPNPFNNRMQIGFNIEQPGMVSLDIFDISGRCITTLFEGFTASGSQTLMWDASSASAGEYLMKLSSSNGQIRTQRAVLLK
ncbi:MAG: T9SS type A sorting domain-containing protein [Candidatus Hatepunaea meridiana]|nr:T9SS type A sorting domain-containing protein [Candidatus Hatepunaea meridiana]